jgi:hypothetical protein
MAYENLQQDTLAELESLKGEISMLRIKLDEDVVELKKRLEPDALLDQGAQVIANRAGFIVGTGIGAMRKMFNHKKKSA